MKDTAFIILFAILFMNIWVTIISIEHIKNRLYLYKTLKSICIAEILILGAVFIYYWSIQQIDIFNGKGGLIMFSVATLWMLAGALESFEKKIINTERINSADAKPRR